MVQAVILIELDQCFGTYIGEGGVDCRTQNVMLTARGMGFTARCELLNDVWRDGEKKGQES